MTSSIQAGGFDCKHCYHRKRSGLATVMPDGHAVQECCLCHQLRTIHEDHAVESEWRETVCGRSEGRIGGK